MKSLVCALFALCLCAGCSYQPAINAAEQVGLKAARDAADNVLLVEKEAFCAQPYETILRHPETWGYINKMCAPGVSTDSPATILTPAAPLPTK